MSLQVSLQVLTPLIAGWAVSVLVRSRLSRENSAMSIEPINQGDMRVYRSPQNLLGVILFFAVAMPIGVFLLPDSVATDVRPLFNIFGVAAGGLLLYAWVYLKLFKITLAGHTLSYGAFFSRTINLNSVTRIRYHWVNNGISLKLFAGKERVGIFEGNVEHFDNFAKAVRNRVPGDAVAEAVGRASF